MSIKGQGHYLTLAKGHSDFKIKTCFSQETFETKFHIKAYGNTGILSHMTKMATMPLYGKNI